MSLREWSDAQLPAGWVIAPMADFVTSRSGNSKLIKGKLSGEAKRGLFQAYSASGPNVWVDDFEYDADAVVVSAVGARCGKSFLAHGKWAAIANTHVVLPHQDGFDPRLLWYGLNDEDFWIKSGSAQPFVVVSKSLLRHFGIPPRAEQTRILEKLEELLSDLDAGVAELMAAQRKLAQYRQSLLKAAVQGASSVSTSKYPEVPLGELVQSIGQGWSPRCERESVDSDADWAVIKTTAIQPLAFDGSHNKKLPSALTPREHLELEVGDLLITRAGPRSRVGITCLIRQVKKRLILCDKAYRIRCDESRIDKEFLELVLNAPHMVNEIDELKTGINDSGLNLTQGRFFTLMIPVPALGQQRRLVEQIHTKVQCIEDQELAIELSLKQSAAQRKNILKAAFTGQLVPQDPNDEPASVLLERIRAERDNVKCPSTRSRRTKPPKRPVEPHV